LWWLRRDDRRDDPRKQAATLLILWFFAAFGMFTITLTKFHHYIFPLVPPVAVFTALVVDYALGPNNPARPKRLAAYVAAMTTGLAFLLYGIMRLFPRRFDGTELAGAPPWLGWGILCAVLGSAIAVGAAVVFRNREPNPDAESPDSDQSDDPLHEKAVLTIAALVSAAAILLAGRDLIHSAPSDFEGQMRIMQLFTYNYRRPWPESLDFAGALVAFTVVASVLSLFIAWKRVRGHAMMMFCATAVLWGAWGVNVYLYKASPHWGQRETILEYYRQRASAAEPIVAYQMNWKGENFYTGNRVPAFVSSGSKFKDWIAEQKKQGVNVMFFTTEHGRIGSLKRELGTVKSFDKLTDEALNNKFFLARVQF
jgi:hypothetical protein